MVKIHLIVSVGSAVVRRLLVGILRDCSLRPLRRWRQILGRRRRLGGRRLLVTGRLVVHQVHEVGGRPTLRILEDVAKEDYN